MRKSQNSVVHNAVQSGLLTEEQAAVELVKGVKVAPLLVDKKGNGLFDWFEGVAVVKKVRKGAVIAEGTFASGEVVAQVKVEVAA